MARQDVYEGNLVTLYLEAYLGPNGIYPYESLAPKMERLHAEDKRVHLVSVPGSLMGQNWLPSKQIPGIRPWSGFGENFLTAEDLLQNRNGEQFAA